MLMHAIAHGGVRTGKVSEKVALGEGWFFIKASTVLLVDSLEGKKSVSSVYVKIM